MTGPLTDADSGDQSHISTSSTAATESKPVSVQTDRVGQDGNETFSDTIAAVVSAILALVFLIVIVSIIRVIRKRRRELQGNRMGQPVVHTISPQMFGANTTVFRNAQQENPVTWEPVVSSSSYIPRSAELDNSLYGFTSLDVPSEDQGATASLPTTTTATTSSNTLAVASTSSPAI
ncbi:uncharacterized protein LOC101860801 [Aplysia californica]|uniref:Uncharacterized protein LOC101860801 n=1 Tax=Aplysia californica TaxID=6500 RepID=A0ABM0JK18_APLCA|nr:uncharacterized protein LOC101860801 [Aplysia californica]